MAFDPLNLLLLAIAIVVFWRLRSVLGSRTGNERPPFDPNVARTNKDAAPADAANGNVVRFPRDDNQPASRPVEPDEARPPVWTGFAEAGSEVAQGIESITAADPAFLPKTFVDGAKLAYEMIVEAFARGDKSALKPLLSREVFEAFSGVIDQRNSAGQKVDSRFVGIDKADIVGASVSGKKAAITMRFVSEIISATLSKDGEVIEGDARQIQQTTDVWTFERDTSSRDPNWKLVATQEPA